MTEEIKESKNVSMFSRSDLTLDTDPLEEIFALNLGDFVSEHLISDELAEKISKKNINKTESLKNQLRELISIYSIDNTLKVLGFSSRESSIAYNAIAETIKQILEIDACHIFLSRENSMCAENYSNDLILAGSSVSISDDINLSDIGYKLDDLSIVSKAFSASEIIKIDNCQQNADFSPVKLLNEDKAVYYLAVPMFTNLEKAGVIVIENYSDKQISDAFIELLTVTAHLFAVSMTLKHLTEETEHLINQDNVNISELQNKRAELTSLIGDLSIEQQRFVENLAEAVSAKNGLDKAEAKEAANLTREIAEYIGLNEKTKDLIYYAALLRNIGRITLPEELFSKKEKLSADDWEKLQNHPNIGVSILMSINFLSEVAPYISCHKEHWDGTGVPEGLKGRSIPLGSRIIAIADAYCSMTSKRSYREALDGKKALEIIKSEAGSKWDPEIVNFLEEIKK